MKDNLFKMNTELLFNLMELLDMLSYRPSQWPAQAEAVGRLMRQMHHLLNVMRRHQVGLSYQPVHQLPQYNTGRHPSRLPAPTGAARRLTWMHHLLNASAQH